MIYQRRENLAGICVSSLRDRKPYIFRTRKISMLRYSVANQLELVMSVCRVVMADFINEAEASDFMKLLVERGKELYPIADSMLVIKTTETSGMTVTIYSDEDAADHGAEVRIKLFDDWKGKIINAVAHDAELIGHHS